MATGTESQTTNKWPGDFLGRKALADFLTASLTEQAAALPKSGRGGLTVALDADWGTGKSFFIRHWADDLRVLGHPVVLFDAWENDIGDEAAIALMASIKEELDTWRGRLPKAKAIRNRASKMTEDVIKGLRRAIVPASKVLATGMVKKLTGVAADELLRTFAEQEDSGVSIDTSFSEALDTSLDRLFKQALEGHHKRKQAIEDFRSSVEGLISLLKDDANALMPLFVFVDEVDRCRPTYGIKLLEEIKHVFGVPNICFVVSTNFSQLRESIRAIYGQGFDGYRYLRRFFDLQYTLPAPDHHGFAAQLLQNTQISSRELVLGVPADSKVDGAADVIALMNSAFDLDLRSQKQVLSMASSVIASIPKGRKVFLLWLFFLVAARYAHPDEFDRLFSIRLDRTTFGQICVKMGMKEQKITHSSPRTVNHQPNTSNLSDVLWYYYDWSFQDLKELHGNSYNIHEYPTSNMWEVARELPSPYSSAHPYPPSIASYAEWVKYVGFSSATASPQAG